jgi:hypothetical protein
MLLGVNNQKANTADNQLIWGLTNHKTKTPPREQAQEQLFLGAS